MCFVSLWLRLSSLGFATTNFPALSPRLPLPLTEVPSLRLTVLVLIQVERRS